MEGTRWVRVARAVHWLAGGGQELVEPPLPLQDTSTDLALCSQHRGPAGLEQPD